MKNRHSARDSTRWIACCALAVVLSSCGSFATRREADKQFEQGHYVEAVQSYRVASDASPENVHYRQEYLNKRDEAVALLLAQGEQYAAGGDLARAEGAYRTLLQVDPNSSAARARIDAVSMRRRHNGQMAVVDELIAKDDLTGAQRLLRTVLAEDPQDPRGLNSQERIRALLAERKAKTALDDNFKKPVTLEFKDVPAKTVFEVLAKASGINFIYDPEIRPDLKVSIFLKSTPLDDAIRMIGLSTQLETRVINNNSMLVYPSTPQKIGDYRPLSVRSFFLANANAKVVADSLKAILKTESLVVDEKLNMLIMRDSPEAIELAEKIINLHDIGDPEVVLDVEVLEVKRTDVRDVGVALPSEIGVSVRGADQASEWLSGDQLRAINSDSVLASVPNASIKLKEDQSNARILANPNIRVQSKQKAKILIGDKVPVITSTSTSTGFVSETVNYVDVGLKLEVEPSVFASNEVAIRINLEVSSLVREITTQSGTLSYQIGTRNAETTLRLRDGETQVLAGLINKEDRTTASGLPWISKFPVLDRLFGNKKTDRQDTEIVLSITPRLVRGVRPAGMAELQFESGTANRLGGATEIAATATVAGLDKPDATGTVAPAAGPVITPVRDVTVAGEALAQPSQVALAWKLPAEVRAGEQFTALLNISAGQAIDQVPLMLGFDPRVLQVVNVEQGPFMTQGGGQSSLTKQVNLTDGRITAAVVRQGSAISGQGTLLQVTFKALTSAEATELEVLSAQTNPGTGDVGLSKASMRIK